MSATSFPRMAESPSVAGRGVAYLIFGVGAGAAVGLGGGGFLTRLNAELVDHSPVAGGGSDAVAAAKDIGNISVWGAILCGVVATTLAIFGLVKGATWIRRGGQGIRVAMDVVRRDGPPGVVHRFAALPAQQRMLRAAAAVVVVAAVIALLVTWLIEIIQQWSPRSTAGIGTTLLIISVLGAAVSGVLAAVIAEKLPRRLVQLQWWWQALTRTGPYSR